MTSPRKAAYCAAGGLVLAAFIPPQLVTGGVSLEFPPSVGKVDGRADTPIPVTVRNLSVLSTKVLIPNSCCTLSGSNEFWLGPMESKRVDINLATHKFPIGPGSFPLAAEYVVLGEHRRIAKNVSYEVAR